VKSRRRPLVFSCLLLAAAAVSSCATPGHQPTLTLEEHTLRMPLAVGANGSVSLAQQPPMTGRIDLSPILEQERTETSPATVAAVQVMMHYGRFYVVADGFRSVWELTPRPGTSTASYRRIPIPLEAGESAMKGCRLSRYGSSQSSCLRLDRKGAKPVFVSARGEVSRACP
jgi:hypothetical protein